MKYFIVFNSLLELMLLIIRINYAKLVCPTNCESCYELSDSLICIYCMKGYCLNPDNTCIKSNIENCGNCDNSNSCTSCLQKYYLSSNQCFQCGSNCLKCSDQYNCTKCDIGYYLENNICEKCIQPCDYCYSSNSCQTCIKGYFYLRKQCLPCSENCNITESDNCQCNTCNDGYFLMDYQCFKCNDPNCKACLGSADNCKTCYEGYYLDSTNSCLACKSPCQTCVNSSICSSCVNNYFLFSNNCYQCNYNCETFESDNCKCKSCYQGYYMSKFQCFECASNCLNCLFSPTNCSDCFEGYHLDLNNICKPDKIYEGNITFNLTIDYCKEIFFLCELEDNKSNSNCIFYKDCYSFYNKENLIDISFDKIKQLMFNNNTINNSSLEQKGQILKKFQKLFNNGSYSINFGIGEDFFLKVDNFEYTITTTYNQLKKNNSNQTIVNLGECEVKLKEKYNISQNESLYILKIDILLNNFRKIEYEVYYSFYKNNYTKLNLSICKNIKIDILIPVEIPKNEIEKYNMSSDLYNDLCYTLTSDAGTDKPLQVRRDEFINNNLSICEEDCIFSEYDDKNKKAVCSCAIKIELPLISTIKVNKEIMVSNFKHIKNIANFNVLKCNHLLFNKENIFKNSANFITIIVFFLSIITIYFFLLIM